jgi:hypothetical protein
MPDATDRSTAIIQTIYAAFGRGDVPAILAHVAAEARFAFAGASPHVPWHGPWHGHAGLGRFFATLAEAVAFEIFAPLAFAVAADAVVVRLHLRYRVHATARVVDEEQVHWWTLRDGQVVDMVHFEDTAQVIAALAR